MADKKPTYWEAGGYWDQIKDIYDNYFSEGSDKGLASECGKCGALVTNTWKHVSFHEGVEDIQEEPSEPEQ